MNVNIIKVSDTIIDIDGEIYEKKPKLEPKFKISDWVYWSGQVPTIGRISKHCDEFADSWTLDNFEGNSIYSSCSESNLRLATNEEIELHLRKIIEKKYVGKNIRCLRTNKILTVINEKYMDGYGHSWGYNSKEDSFNVASPYVEWFKNTSNPVVYMNGKWADIVTKKSLPTTKEELKAILIDFYGCDSMNIEEFLEEY
jgi:hypothetical protein